MIRDKPPAQSAPAVARAAANRGAAFREWLPGERVTFTAPGTHHSTRRYPGVVVGCRQVGRAGNNIHIQPDVGTVVEVMGDRVRAGTSTT